jgi:hypothetical protein
MTELLTIRMLWTTPTIIHPFAQNGNGHDK